MKFIEEMKSKSEQDLEEWFLGALSEDSIPVDEMLQILQFPVYNEDSEKRNGFAELLLDELVNRKDGPATLKLMHDQCQWGGDDASLYNAYERSIRDAFGSSRGKALAEGCGFTDKLRLKECVRRLGLLARLKPEVLCRDKTWGFGVVKDVDDFYAKVKIDFDTKKGHQMSFAYAAETLELIGEDHILSMRHRHPEQLDELVKSDAAGVVKMTLASYGEKSAPELQDTLVPGIVSEDGWKKFWDSARKELKKDPLVDVPSKRNDPVRLLSKQKEYDAEWFDALKVERDSDTILELLKELEKSGIPDKEEWREVIVNRLAFVLKGAKGERWDRAALVLMAAKRMGFGEDVLDSDVSDALKDVDIFLSAVTGLPARSLREFMCYLDTLDDDGAFMMLAEAIDHAELSVVSEIIEHLVSTGREAECVQSVKAILETGSASAEVICYLCRNLDDVIKWGLAKPHELMVQVVSLFNGSRIDERAKTLHQLGGLVEKRTWISKILGLMDAGERSDVISRVNNARAWDVSVRRSVMARMIKMYPELADVIASGAGKPEKEVRRGRFTSIRSYRERTEQHRRIIDTEIPANSKEIAVARSYGDLRENAEYETARNNQALLMRRKAEMERDLAQVQGTDFKDFNTAVAGMGTRVTLLLPDGESRSYNILGEWDRDEDLDIISSQSALAKALLDHSKGDQVTIPSEEGEKNCEIADIAAISDEIKEWVNGDNG